MATIICPHCGTANRSGSNFCNTCGTDLRMDETTVPASDEPTADRDSEQVQTHTDIPASALGAAATSEEQRPISDLEAPPPDDDLSFPRFDLGLASPGAEEESWLADQPWLQDTLDDAEPDMDEAAEIGVEKSVAHGEGRLITGVQGLLAPLNITSQADDGEQLASSSAVEPARVVELSLDQMRHFRRLMGEEPMPSTGTSARRGPGWPSLRVPWLFWLIGLAVAIPVILLPGEPTGEARLWPGVREAHRVIDGLPSGASVLAYWAYDPATSGEMDMVAEPVLQHLLARRAQVIVASTLPGGPASARRLVATTMLADSERDRAPGRPKQVIWRNVTLATADSFLVANVFLPGGAAALPLLAQDLPAILGGSPTQPNANQQAQSTGEGIPIVPVLNVVFAAEAEDVQHWLEQVQPLADAPVIAVTSAGVDPMVRPYWESGQLRGLVSGFDGAYHYAEFNDEARTFDESQKARQRLVAQNWGQLALLIIVGVGNLAALLGRRREA